MLITIVVVMLEGSVLVRYITSFTEEVFATLISLIFIYEVFRKLYVVSIQTATLWLTYCIEVATGRGILLA